MTLLIEAFLLGLIGGIIPGAVLTVLLVSVIQGGFSSGLRAFRWSLLAEVTVVGILLVFLFTLPIPVILFNYIGLFGCLVLLYFAWQVFHIQKIDQPEQSGTVFTAKEIFILSVTNAPLYIFWVTVCTPLILQLAEMWSLTVSAVTFMISFEIGWGLSTFIVMLLFVKARKYITEPRIMRKVYTCASIAMFLLGFKMLYSSLVLLGIM